MAITVLGPSLYCCGEMALTIRPLPSFAAWMMPVSVAAEVGLDIVDAVLVHLRGDLVALGRILEGAGEGGLRRGAGC